MPTQTEAEAAHNLLWDLEERAIEIVRMPDPHRNIHVHSFDPDRVFLDFDGETAKLSWPEPIGEDSYISWEEITFPSYLLFLNEADFNLWKQEKLDAAEKERQEKLNTFLSNQETHERALLNKLKQKYEG